MQPGFMTFLIALGAVTLAEMGDKTQLLAMCFTTRYRAGKVLTGVFIATVINHALAVAAGYFLRELLSSYAVVIQLAASLSFIGFGLWTIRGDSIDDSCDRRSKWGPVMTVTIAFFIAEMGDKTQLATVSLATKFENPFSVLLGTTAGMLVADSIGIIFGVVMSKKIPENVLKWISASVFALCGLVGYIQSASGIMNLYLLIFTTILIVLITIYIALYFVKKSQKGCALEEAAADSERRIDD